MGSEMCIRDRGTMGITPNERQLNREFSLNLPEFQGASILITRDNFGCGSSREHAVWALKEFGFRAVLAPSFADIFFGNCFKNGLLPITLPEEVIDDLFKRVATGLTLLIDLGAQTVTDGEHVHGFEIDLALKEKMLTGMDDIDLTLAEAELIRSFEAGHRQRQPWLFRD